MKKEDSVTLSYQQLITLLRLGPFAVSSALDLMREVYGDTAPQYDATLWEPDRGGLAASFCNHNVH